MKMLLKIDQSDRKATQMYTIYAEQRFSRPRLFARSQLLQCLWALKVKLRPLLKRLVDLTFTSIMLLLLAPLMLLVVIAIKLDSPGPVLFRQTRLGKGGKPFQCLKFRSMFMDAEQRKQQLLKYNEADGPVFKIRHDPRVTRIGRFIRKTSIDELPQLFNVLRGEMSLVGPRPALPSEVVRYNAVQLQRLDVVPGITGLQQISGRSNIDFAHWIQFDLDYITQQSLRQDIYILCMTVPTVLRCTGAY